MQKSEVGIEDVESLYFLLIRFFKVECLEILESCSLESQVCLFVQMLAPRLCKQLGGFVFPHCRLNFVCVLKLCEMTCFEWNIQPTY